MGTKKIIVSLRKTFRVFYLSDNVKERADFLDAKYDFSSLFDGGCFSHETGFRKPDPRAFQAVLDKAHCKPEESIFIDDKAKNLPPAQKMGITCFLFSSPDTLRRQFSSVGIRVLFNNGG